MTISKDRDVVGETFSKEAMRLPVQGGAKDDSPKETHEMDVILSLRGRMRDNKLSPTSDIRQRKV